MSTEHSRERQQRGVARMGLGIPSALALIGCNMRLRRIALTGIPMLLITMLAFSISAYSYKMLFLGERLTQLALATSMEMFRLLGPLPNAESSLSFLSLYLAFHALVLVAFGTLAICHPRLIGVGRRQEACTFNVMLFLCVPLFFVSYLWLSAHVTILVLAPLTWRSSSVRAKIGAAKCTAIYGGIGFLLYVVFLLFGPTMQTGEMP